VSREGWADLAVAGHIPQPQRAFTAASRERSASPTFRSSPHKVRTISGRDRANPLVERVDGGCANSEFVALTCINAGPLSDRRALRHRNPGSRVQVT
jgi:hypothetical protein